MKRLILYDLDGTLVDTRLDIAQAANHMLQQLRAPALPVEAVCRFVGRGVHQLVSGCLHTDDPALIEEGVRIYRAHYTEHLLDSSRLYPGVREVLEHFKTRRQAVITNKPNPYSRQILIGLGVADYFLEIIAGDSPYPKKPDPSAVLALMEQERLTPTETCIVGDSSIDVETGRLAGVFTIGVAQGFSDDEELAAASPDAMVRDFHELLSVAKREGW